MNPLITINDDHQSWAWREYEAKLPYLYPRWRGPKRSSMFRGKADDKKKELGKSPLR
jgi:hypothetical protein